MNYKFLIRMSGPAIFLIILFFFIDITELKKTLHLLRYDCLWLSLFTVPLIIAVRSIRWKRILAVYKINCSVWVCFKYNFVEMVAIAIVSTAGSLIKVFYLRRNGSSLLHATLAVVTDKAFDYILPLLFGLFSSVIFYYHFDPDTGLLWLLLVTCLVFKPLQIINVRFFPRIIPGSLKKKMNAKEWQFDENFQQIVRSLDFYAYILSIIGFLLYFLSVHFLNLGLGISLSFSEIIFIMAITSLITAIPISFLGIGTRDVALITVFTWFGRTPEEAISLSIALLLLRLAIMLMGSVFWYFDPPPLSALKKTK
jgi:uncharacterized protein (TIRG00374 family)